MVDDSGNDNSEGGNCGTDGDDDGKGDVADTVVGVAIPQTCDHHTWFHVIYVCAFSIFVKVVSLISKHFLPNKFCGTTLLSLKLLTHLHLRRLSWEWRLRLASRQRQVLHPQVRASQFRTSRLSSNLFGFCPRKDPRRPLLHLALPWALLIFHLEPLQNIDCYCYCDTDCKYLFFFTKIMLTKHLDSTRSVDGFSIR